METAHRTPGPVLSTTVPAVHDTTGKTETVHLEAFARSLVADVLAESSDKDCGSTGFSGQGRCIEPATSMCRKDGSIERVVLVVRADPGNGRRR